MKNSESYVTMPARVVLDMARKCIKDVDQWRSLEKAQAIAKYRRRGWWIFRPSPSMTDEEILRELWREFEFFDHGWGSRDVAERLEKALTVDGIGETVYVSTSDLAMIRGANGNR